MEDSFKNILTDLEIAFPGIIERSKAMAERLSEELLLRDMIGKAKDKTEQGRVLFMFVERWKDN